MVLATASLILGGSASAQTLTLTGDDARVIAQVAQRLGDTDYAEDIIQTPSIVVHRDSGEVWFRGDFIGCTDGVGCQAIALTADFGELGLTNDQLNEFNREYFYVRAFTNFQNSVILQQDLSLTNGVNDEWLFQAFATYGRMVDTFGDWAAPFATAPGTDGGSTLWGG